MFELIMDEAWEIKEYSLPYGVFLTQFLISRGVVIAASDTRKEVKSALNKFTLSRSRGQEGALTRRFARRAAAAAEEASRPSTSASEAPMETGAPAVPPPWVAQLFADLDSRVSATMKATLQPVERQMQSLGGAAEGAPDRLRWGVHCDNAAQQVGRGSYGGRQRAAGRN
ncbi:hypothetical protein CJ030_MR3G015748 [Morella rubra]|uniref:Uncharacterized protein n=1 Tax=Morella rubra TaxID=262757 RepID=A0A6A1W5T6_9ROSI|nr:hypothetical protein CJ030_MR3G015748 [Morella rubra]